jgi:uncharacterized protein YbbK (DUF523 family)
VAKMEKVLVSACLVGNNCKYNGGNNKNEKIIEYLKDKEVILVCPEVMGGLDTPRLKSEIDVSKQELKVINEKRDDVTSYFVKGAKIALKKALTNNVKVAILKEKSPSCGYRKIYNGNFDGSKVAGSGVFTRMLIENNVRILTEEDFE